MESCLRVIGRVRAVFSLDLKQGRPLTVVPDWRERTPGELAALAVSLGAGRVIVLDLARVGVGQGPGQEELCRQLRAEHPDLELIAGGGVRGREDLRRLAAAGCDAVLVASALHDGRLTREDLREFSRVREPG